MKIVITGNIGCGKSTFVKYLLEALPGYSHFDFDAQVHGLYANDEYLGEVQLLCGTTDRKSISDIVFSDVEKKHQVEELSIKYLKPALARAVAAGNVIVEFPLLFEAGWSLADFDKIVTIKCSDAMQLERVKTRNGFSDEKIQAIRASQCSTAVKVALADVVVDSECSFEELKGQAARVAKIVQFDQLRERFIAEFGSVPMWNALESAYSDKLRWYHTLMHLFAMFAHYDCLTGLKNARAVRWAIWFHDFVYATSPEWYGQNEALSAQAMFRLIRTYRPDLLSSMEDGTVSISLAAEMILATKGHLPASPYFQSRPTALADCGVFLDIDLSILAQPAHVTEQFDDSIRLEFVQYDDAAFAHGRVAALSSFLDRDRIYFSPQFAHLESDARRTLETLIARWRTLKV